MDLNGESDIIELLDFAEAVATEIPSLTSGALNFSLSECIRDAQVIPLTGDERKRERTRERERRKYYRRKVCTPSYNVLHIANVEIFTAIA